LVLGATILAFMVAAHAYAAGEASPEDAKAMAVKAAAYLKSVGPDKAFAEFSAKEGPWHDQDLYVTVQNSQGVMMAHGDSPALIGKSMLDLKDIDGKPFIREKLAVADTGWIDYKWRNPVTKAIERKTQFVVRVGDYTVGVGAYAK